MSKADRAALLTSAINELVNQHTAGDLGKPYADIPTSGRGKMEELVSTTVYRLDDTKKKLKARLQRSTRPWTHEEYMYLDGVPHVYSVNPEVGTMLHLRGGGTLLLRDAWVKRHQISGPIKLRLDDLYDANIAKLVRKIEDAEANAQSPGDEDNE